MTVSATAGAGGTVAAGGVTAGSCAGTACTFPTVRTGSVTFTPTADAGYRFGAWSGASCTGFTNGVDGAITFTNPSSNKACTATFVKQVTISWRSCHCPDRWWRLGRRHRDQRHLQATDPTGGGSCVVTAGVGSVTLTATPLASRHSTDGPGRSARATNPVVITSPSTNIACTATFGLDLRQARRRTTPAAPRRSRIRPRAARWSALR